MTNTSNGQVARQQRQVQARIRQEVRDACTTEQQLAALDVRPGDSTRERARLAQR